MERFGGYLVAHSATMNATLGHALLDDAVDFRAAILKSISLTLVRHNRTNTPYFLPPYAAINFTVFDTMTDRYDTTANGSCVETKAV